MPPKRNTRAAAARRSTPGAGQGTLSFSKGQPNRVTKQAAPPPPAKGKKPDAAAAAQIEAAGAGPAAVHDIPTSGPPAADDPLDDVTARTEDVLGGRATPGAEEDERDAQEAQDDRAARAVGTAEIKSYWREKERARLAPRVHQEELGLGEKILREWDMSGQFGPCIGISREKRWRRARKLGLEPPVEVLAVLLGGLEGTDKKEAVEERAHVDRLMGNRFEVVA